MADDCATKREFLVVVDTAVARPTAPCAVETMLSR